jgi:hypothetical protein
MIIIIIRKIDYNITPFKNLSHLILLIHDIGFHAISFPFETLTSDIKSFACINFTQS